MPRHIFGEEADQYSNHTEVVPGVFVEPGDFVAIVDRDGEVAYWSNSEWEDSDAITATVNAVALAASKGPAAVRESLNHKNTAHNPLTNLIDETMQRTRPDGDQIIVVPIDGISIVVTITPPDAEGNRSGKIETNIHKCIGVRVYNRHAVGVVKGIEQMILAQALAGMDVANTIFLDALETCLMNLAEEINGSDTNS